MKSFFNSLLGTLAAIALIVAVAGGYGACAGRPGKIGDGSWLIIELQADLPEYDPPGGLVGQLTGGGGETLQRLLGNLEKARVDDRIAGVILKAGSGLGAGAATAGEIRDAVSAVKSAGKKVYVWADSFERADYAALAAADEILMPPTGYVSFTGAAAGSMHVRNLLDKVGIVPNVHKIKDYKSAAELVTTAESSEPARENKAWLLDEGWIDLTAMLQKERGLDEARVTALMEMAVMLPTEALEGGLIDRLAYWDELEAELKGDEDELATVSSARYAKEDPEDLGLGGDRTIAVIHAQGMIMGRQSGVNPLFGVTMGHESIVAELKRAREDDDVAAIILRVDSPGGDALGSDLMGHEVEITAKVKPVVVSMVDVAASGGYHISYRASRILARPMTVTGSIGSISGKFNMRPMMEKAGITMDAVTRGPSALMDSAFSDYSEAERARFEANHWASFNNWLKDVAEHRGLTFEKAETLAHGRVWSGRQGVENGLVDELGGLVEAVAAAKKLAEIPADEAVTVAHYPEAKSLLQTLMGNGDVTAAARWIVYRSLQQEVRETWSLVQSNPELVLGPMAP